MENEQTLSFDMPGIMSCQRNRYPMLFLDRVTECVPFKYAKGVKLFSYSEHFFAGHYPGRPVAPESVLFEAMLQTFLMTFLTAEELTDRSTAIQRSSMRFYRPVLSGEKLDITAVCKRYYRGVAAGRIECHVNGELVCDVEPIIVVLEVFRRYFPNAGKNEVERTSAPPAPVLLDINGICDCVPQTSPWMFLDAVTELIPGERAYSYKNFTYNEWFFPVHFPEHPNVPGFLQFETALQGLKLVLHSAEKFRGELKK